MNTVHFTYDLNMEKTHCGKDGARVRFATSLDGEALFLAEYFAAYMVRPCKACVNAAREKRDRQKAHARVA